MSAPDSNRLTVLAADIRTNHAGVKAAAEIAAAHAIAAGQALIEAKALVGHGRWLAWLKTNCGFAERTAQLYMSLAEKGTDARIVAALGLKAASTAFEIRDDSYNPFAGCTPQRKNEWLLFACFIRSWTHCEWVIQRGFASPGEWLGPIGEEQRRFWGMRPVPDATRKVWKDYCADNRDASEDGLGKRLADIESENAAHEPSPSKRRRLKSAPVADFIQPKVTHALLAERLKRALALGDLEHQRAEIAAIASALARSA